MHVLTIFAGTQAAAGELEEGVAQLQQQHVRVVVLEDEHHTIYAPAHPLHPVPVQRTMTGSSFRPTVPSARYFY